MDSRRHLSAQKISAALVLAAAVLVAGVIAATSRLQMADAGPGVLVASVPVPALVLLLVALVSAKLAGSFRRGLATGFLALAAALVALVAVLAVEGPVWMDRNGVYMLDGDPPLGAVSTADVVFDLFSTGMWSGHMLLWVPGVLIGAAAGAWLGGRRKSPGAARESVA